jgi:hypothetical protein
MLRGTWVKVIAAGRGPKFERTTRAAPEASCGKRRLSMFAIVYKADGVPICVQVAGISPDPVVVWNSESAAKAFIDSKGGAADYQAVAVTEQTMDKLAKALGCPVEKLMLEPYPS